MVGRLVKHKQVVWLQQKFCQRQSRMFATRQHLHLLVDVLAREKECAENIPDFCAYVANGNAVKCFKYSQFWVKEFVLVLSKIANIYVVTDFQFARILGFTDDDFRQSSLAFAVSSDESNLLATLNHKVNLIEDKVVAIAFA